MIKCFNVIDALYKHEECYDSSLCLCFLAGDPCASLTQRPWLGQNLRELLSLPDTQHPQQHGGETAALQEYDLHLDRSVVLLAVVGEVSASWCWCWCLYLLLQVLVLDGERDCTS